MAFLCVSQQGEFKNTIKNFLGKVHVKSFWPKKLSFFFPPPFVFTQRFCAFLNKGSSKTPQNTFWGKYMSKAFGRKS
jgi:hypothetical protein